MALDLDSRSAQAEELVSELDREYHLHFSGQKPTYEVEPIYQRHADLLGRDAIEELREGAAGESEDARRASFLLELAVGGHLGRGVAKEEEAIAAREVELDLEVGGERIPYRMAPAAQANEPDPERRAQIDAARLAALDRELNPLHRAALERTHELIRELGWGSYAEAWAQLRGIDLEGLAAQTRRFSETTDPLFEAIVGPEVERVLAEPLARIRRPDLARFFRAPELDSIFPEGELIPALERTAAGMGLALERQPNIRLDIEQRPTKTARAYCAPVRVPDEVYLVVPRVGGREDYAALFHESGHALHYANVEPTLPAEYRYLGDNSVTESFAFLIEHLTEDEGWLAGVLGQSADGVPGHARAMKLMFLRRYAAKIAYELELHGPDPDLAAMPNRYAELMQGPLGLEWTPVSWLSDVDDGFYVAGYLRAWALESRWRATLQQRFGERWFAEPAAGEWLLTLWRQGQRLRADELLSEVLGEELDFGVLAAEFV